MKKRVLAVLLVALASGAVLWGCKKEEMFSVKRMTEVKAPVRPESPEDYDGWRAYREENGLTEEELEEIRSFSWSTASLLMKDTEENESYSPISLYMALSLAAYGAENETEAELLRLLGAENKENLAGQCRKLYNSLYLDGTESAEGNKSRRKLANSVWMDKDMKFKEAFLKRAEEDFYSSLYTVDFSEKQTARAMENWVKEETEGLISPQMKANPEQVMSILNAVYFYDEWVDCFSEKNTKPDLFYKEGAAEESIETDFMNREASGSFAKSDGFLRAELSLKESGSMVFVLPEKGREVDSLLEDGETLREAFFGGTDFFGTITWKIPKFSFGRKYDLKEALEMLGASSAFDENADFSAMTEDKVWIDSIRQETHIGINEKGVEAAAYTELMYAGEGLPQEHAEMILNRPFLYAVMSRGDLPLFVGVYRGE